MGKKLRNYIELPKNCNHLELYLFLKKHFGKPSYTNYRWNGKKYKNDYQKNGTPRDQWRYTIKTPNSYIDIYDRERSWLMISLYLCNDSAKLEEEQVGLAERDLKVFMDELQVFCNQILGKNKNVNEGIIVLNSFDIHYSNFRYHMNLLKRLTRKYNSSGHFHDPIIRYQMKMLTVSSFILLISSFEGFVNLLYECFLKEQIRNDTTILTEVQNLRLESKIKMLSLYCNAFSKSFSQVVSVNSDLYRRFKNTMALRNKLSHGNFSTIAYTNMAEADGFLFYLNFKRDLLFNQFIGSGEKLLNFLDNTEKTIQDLIRQILKMMAIPRRKEIKELLRHNWIGYTRTKEGIKFVTDEIW